MKKYTLSEVVEMPWLSLPEQVRENVCRRMNEIYGKQPEQNDVYVHKLADLSAYRLINMCAGNVKEAIKYARLNHEDKYPISILGDRESDWVDAYNRASAEKKALEKNEASILRAKQLFDLVLEELNSLP